VANQLGAARTLCEAYGAGGWDLRFEDMKRIGDWIHVLGVNTLNEHLSYITIRGARKRDHPQSFSYHEPWWKDYHMMAWASIYSGLLLDSIGEFKEAISVSLKGAEYSEKTDAYYIQGLIYGTISTFYARQGNLTYAEES
jgi:hypothetical protein